MVWFAPPAPGGDSRTWLELGPVHITQVDTPHTASRQLADTRETDARRETRADSTTHLRADERERPPRFPENRARLHSTLQFSPSGPTRRSLADGCTPQAARTAAAGARSTHTWTRRTGDLHPPRSAHCGAPRIHRDSEALCTPQTQPSPARRPHRRNARGRYARPPASCRRARESRATCDLRGSDRA